MELWVWIIGVWLTVGIAITVANSIQERRHKGLDLFESSFLEKAAFHLILIFGAPVIVLFSVAVGVQMLWEGRVPITDWSWWPKRAKRFRGPIRRETIVCRMIEVRRRHDSTIRERGSASGWMMADLWDTPEWRMLEMVEQFRRLEHDGLSKPQIQEKIDAASPGGDVDPSNTKSLSQYIKRRLSIEAPEYIATGPRIFERALAIADKWMADEIEFEAEKAPYPPAEWLRERIHIAEFERWTRATEHDLDEVMGEFVRGQNRRHWRDMKTRMLRGDELWIFRSPPDTWEQLCGRSGIALVRSGKPIAHLITEKN
jgi:hypothetical protein